LTDFGGAFRITDRGILGVDFCAGGGDFNTGCLRCDRHLELEAKILACGKRDVVDDGLGKTLAIGPDAVFASLHIFQNVAAGIVRRDGAIRILVDAMQRDLGARNCRS
jgi:hypothetical protein